MGIKVMRFLYSGPGGEPYASWEPNLNFVNQYDLRLFLKERGTRLSLLNIRILLLGLANPKVKGETIYSSDVSIGACVAALGRGANAHAKGPLRRPRSGVAARFGDGRSRLCRRVFHTRAQGRFAAPE